MKMPRSFTRRKPAQAAHHDGRSFARDLAEMQRQASRRRILGIMAGATILPLVGCSTSAISSMLDGGVDAATTPRDLAGADFTIDSCSKIPTETGGPYPGDGTNGPNVLTLNDVVRSDIRSSIGGFTGVAAGVPLTVTLTVVDTNGCAPLAGRAVYIWHCDVTGNYSMYTGSATSENYLRGVQVTDDNGQVTFTTIYPACYSGRWPHIHFEVFPSLAVATSGTKATATSQLAMPDAANKLVFAQSAYSASVSNYGKVSLASDNVFSDGAATETPSMSGDVTAGFAASLVVGV